MTSHGIECPIWLAVWVSSTSLLWKLTLSQLNPGQRNKGVRTVFIPIWTWGKFSQILIPCLKEKVFMFSASLVGEEIGESERWEMELWSATTTLLTSKRYNCIREGECELTYTHLFTASPGVDESQLYFPQWTLCKANELQ